ncbi:MULTISPECIES: hypothetical protein [unclassified Enterococcus]|uniref:hypothetical protein n=1 Tax=unclassified Enterococcus TaxID=2608891 RepID=UPI00190629DC|nr:MULTISPECIES: hypothetical protein [unclassified Enterococcus]MBK0038880.1 hypothetical protein [Enterococcus sp. S52]MBK0070817.1 hypothetical protein [Enterococcus sp. S53]MBK0142356.1 hypothetical protein [Enterococcus sp. S76]MBK0146053.1 hypothetical protein [Enterococcus sp. S77]
MGNYILRFTKLPKEIKATKRLTLKKKYSLPEARELFYQVQADVGPLDNKMTLEIHRIEGTKDYWEFTLPLTKDVPLDLLIDEDIIQELRNLKGSQKEQFEELENDLLVEFDQSFEPVEQEVNEPKPSFLSGLSLPEVKLPEVAENLLSRVLPKKQQVAVPLIEESPSENFVEEALELPEDNYVPDYETVEEEDGVPLEDLEMEKEEILSPQASQNDIVPSTVKESIPSVVIPPLDAYLDLTTQPIFNPIESLIAKLEAKLDRQTQELIVYFDLADKNDFISERKKEFIRTQYNPTFYKQLISSLYKLKNDVENKLIKKLTIAYQEITADDGSEECLAELAAKKAILSEEFTDKIEAAFTSLENQLALDKARIQKRQQEELERLNKRHQDELYQIDVKLQADKQEKAAQLNQMRQEAIEQEEEKITASYEEKAHKSQYSQLIERKNSQLEELSTILVESVQQVTDQELQYLQSMKSKLIESQPVFEEQRRIHEQELREKAVLAQRDRELAIKEKELSLKDKAVQNVESTKQQNQQKEMEISQFLAKLFDDQTRRGAENLATQQQLLAFIQQQQQGTPLQAAPTQPSAVQQAAGKPSLWKKITLSGAVLLAVAGFGGYVHAIAQQDSNQTTVSAAVQTENSYASFESTEPAVPSYDDQISAGKYIEAAKEYPENIDHVVQVVFEKEDTDTLKQLTKLGESDYGLLDLAILQQDQKAITSIYQELSDALKKDLTMGQKQQIASAYLLQDKPKEAKSVLE